ncbi:hypothetical protein FMUND_753 [Fusarium mundagurra]|uniref:Uncharacterized protein n=1 Tax=Fusarium mundagurra TaxID=1567541 RepID=A0A8H5Z5I5_9HYPO|nr:hypothetical protein FMUND_753 [Fusarium mundagurra]
MLLPNGKIAFQAPAYHCAILWMLVEGLFKRFDEHLVPSKIGNSRKGDLTRLRLAVFGCCHLAFQFTCSGELFILYDAKKSMAIVASAKAAPPEVGSWTVRDIQMTNSVPAAKESIRDAPRHREIANCQNSDTNVAFSLLKSTSIVKQKEQLATCLHQRKLAALDVGIPDGRRQAQGLDYGPVKDQANRLLVGGMMNGE